jgi:tetraacyldisaccharide 4'-kinase
MQVKLKFPDVHVAVDRNRVRGIQTLIDRIRKLDAVILDDAFQHRYVTPGLSILLTDYNRPFFNDFLLPAGNLREPRKNSERADIIIVTKCTAHLSPQLRADFIARLNPAHNQEIYFTRYTYGSILPVFPDKRSKPYAIPYKLLHKSGMRIMLVTGIANPSPLKQFLQKIIQVSEEIIFPDHHYYSKQDLRQIKSKFRSIVAREKYIIVTEKDAVRIRELSIADKDFKKAFYYIPVEVKFLAKGEKPFIKRIYRFTKNAGK